MRPHARPVVLAVAWLFIAVSFGACAGGRSRDPICEWADETASPLEPGNRAAGRHMNHDALVAEELAIRYADVRRGHRSGQFKGNDEYRQTREVCLATLSRAIAANHGITSAQVMDAVGRRDDRLDAAVVLLFAAVYGFVANAVVTRLIVRFPPDEPWPALIGTALSAPFVSVAGVVVGGLGASMVEMIWVGDTHLSYRAFRIPWSQHWLLFYFGGLALFCVIAGARLGFRDRGRKLAA